MNLEPFDINFSKHANCNMPQGADSNSGDASGPRRSGNQEFPRTSRLLIPRRFVVNNLIWSAVLGELCWKTLHSS